MPQPSLITRINAVLLFGVCLFLIGAFLSTWVSYNPFGAAAGTLALLAIVPLAWRQYRALVYNDARRVAKLLRALVVLDALTAILLFSTITVILQGKGSFISRIDELAFAFAPFGWLVLSSVSTFFWLKGLRGKPSEAESTDAVAIARDTPSIERGLVVALAVAGLIAAGFLYGRDDSPRRLMHGTAQESKLKLPPGSSDVCLRRYGPHGLMFNFAIDEPGFWQWAESMDHSREPHGDHPAILPITESVSIWAPVEDEQPFYETHVIQHGWFYHHMIGGRGLDYAYDADEGRAYFQNHPD